MVDNKCQAVTVQGNLCNNNGISGTNQEQGVKLYGPQDVTVAGNTCNFNTQNGIYTQTGDLATAHLTLDGNMCMFNNAAGIWLDNGGTTCFVMNNKIAYNGDAGMKVLGYSNSVFTANDCYNQNGQEGIRFDDNGSSHCTGNGVFNNRLFDDRGGSASQSYGFRELGASSNNQITGNYASGNTSAQYALASGSTTVMRQNVGWNPVGKFSSQPGFPLTTAAYTNNLNADATVFITGGTITAIAIGGNATGLTSGSFRVPGGRRSP